jgi:7-cyano-7-deazaguanine synthase in queuosine biosynthesis
MLGIKNAVVLLSGGIDSSTTLAITLERGFDAHCLTFAYVSGTRPKSKQPGTSPVG